MMTMKSFRLDDETLKYIRIIKEAKGLKSEKDVVVTAIEQYMLSEMIEHESVEFKTFQKMNEIEDALKRLNSKMNHVDLGVSINNLFLASDFEIKKHPKAIIDRDTLDGYYFSEARKEIQKMIREKDNHNRKNSAKENYQTAKEVEDRETNIKKKFVDDDWLDV